MGNIRRGVQTLAERGNPRRGRYLKRSEVLVGSVRSSQPNNKLHIHEQERQQSNAGDEASESGTSSHHVGRGAPGESGDGHQGPQASERGIV